MTNKILVFVPTFNERENAPKLCEEILALPENLDILFIDDSSPDGTGELLDTIALENPRVHVVHRGGKFGIGVRITKESNGDTKRVILNW